MKFNRFDHDWKGYTRQDYIVIGWIQAVRTHKSGYSTAYDLWAYGCPKWAIRAVCDVTGLKGFYYGKF